MNWLRKNFQNSSSSPAQFWPQAAGLALLAILYWAMLRLGLLVVAPPGNIASISPASGLALAVLLLAPKRQWPSILGVIFLVSLAVDWSGGISLPGSIGYGALDALEALLAAWLLIRFCGPKITFRRIRDISVLLGVVLLANGLTSLLAAGISWLAFGAPVGSTWAVWWISDGLGMLLVAPLIVTWATGQNIRRFNTPRRMVESVLFFTLLTAFSWLLFGKFTVAENPVLRNYMLFPFLIWLAFRYSPRAMTGALSIVAIIAIWNTLQGNGIFAFTNQDILQHLLSVQSMLITLSVTGLYLSVVVTERRQADLELRESQAKFQYEFDHSPTGRSTTLLSGEMNPNPAFCAMLGFSLQEMQHRNWQELTHPEDVALNLEVNRQLLSAEKEAVRFTKRFIHKDGSIVWADVASTLRRDLQGQPLYFMTTFLDITARKQAEAALQKSEAQLRLILDATPFPIALVDLQDDKIEFWSHSALALFGHTAPTSAEWYALAYPDPDYRQAVVARWKPILETARLSGQPVNSGEYRVTCRDGSVRICELYATFLAEMLVVTFNDVTERKLAEEAVKDSETRLRLLIEHGQDNISLLSADGILLWESPSVDRMLGYAPDQFIGRNMFEMIHPDDVAWLQDTFTRLVQIPGKTQKGIFRLLHADGSWHWVECSASNLLNQPAVQALVVNYHDITERKQADEALRNSEELWHSLVNASPDYIALHDSEGRYLFLNHYAEGFTEKEVIGTSLYQYLLPESVEEYRANIEKALSTWCTQQFEYAGVGDNDAPRVYEEYLVPFHGKDQQDLLMIIARDITERKQAEKLQDAIYRIAQAADQAETLDALYPAIHAIIREVMVADNFYIALYDEAADLLSFPYSQDEIDPDLPPQKPGRGLTEYVLRTGKSLLCDETLFESLQQRGELELVGVSSPIWLGVPLAIGGRTFGVIAVQDYRNPQSYGPAEQRMLEFVSSQAASAIHRKQDDEQIRKLGQHYQALIEKAPDGIVLLYADGSFKYVSPSARKLFGFSGSEMITGNPVTFMHPDDLSQVLPELARLLQEPSYIPILQYRFADKNGNWRWVESTFSNLLAEPSVESIVINFRDITERRQAEARLKDSEQRFRDIAENAQEWIWEVDAQGKITYASPVIEKILGYSPQEVLQKYFYDLFAPQEKEALKAATLAAFAAGQPFQNFINLNLHKDGRSVWISTSGFPMLDGQGHLLGYRGVDTDITELKRTEELLRDYSLRLEQRVEERTQALRQAQEELVRQEKLAVLGQLAGGVGHELRNPLAVITNAVYFLKMIQPEAQEKVRQYLNIIEKETRNSGKIIADLLDFAHTRPAQPRSVPVEELVRSALEQVQVPADVQRTLDLPADLPLLFVDPAQVEQVLGNLLTNACQAMIHGGQLSIRACSDRSLIAAHGSLPAGSWVRISVQDTGTGISPADMEKIFEPLFTTRAKGIGLGLAVGRKLAEANGGRIEVESQPGQGSTFTLVLPVVTPPAG